MHILYDNLLYLHTSLHHPRTQLAAPTSVEFHDGCRAQINAVGIRWDIEASNTIETRVICTRCWVWNTQSGGFMIWSEIKYEFPFKYLAYIFDYFTSDSW